MKRVWVISLVGVVTIGAVAALCLLCETRQPIPDSIQPSIHNASPSANVAAASAPRPTSPSSPPQIAESIRAVVHGDSFSIRLHVVHALGANLSPAEIESLYAFLQGRIAGVQLTKPQDRVLKNDIMNKLRAQERAPSDLTRVLISVYRDRTQDVVIRDYAIQHLHSWYSNALEKEQIQQVFWEALKEIDSSIGGTALIALHRLGIKHVELDGMKIERAALSIAEAENCGEQTRIAALQVCGERGVSDALPVAARLAQSASTISMRVSAIAALGNLGGADALGYLELIATGNDVRLHAAAKSALQRLRKRSEV